jgi:DnaJ-domain-containing protein 1
VLVLASVFAGLTVMLAVLGFAYSPVALVVSLPFGVVTYLLWYHASGRLRERVRREARAGRRRTTERGGFGAGPREDWTGPRGGGGFEGARQRRTAQQATGPSARDAYRTLGLDSDADESAIKRAYREKVKETHPDTENGSERRFKRVNEAYERLSE